jgi:small subunit ribosomal protein S6
MPVQLYETLFLLDSAKLAAEPDAVRGQLHTLLERYGATIDVSRPWDDRKLAYPIKKQKKGAYHIIYYRIDSLKQADIERDLKLNENLLRHMTLLVDEKWAEAVMDAARNDHGAAFAIRGMQEEVSPTDANPALSENVPEGEAVAAATGGRRPHRREPVGEKPD